jgi:hypothetical protein
MEAQITKREGQITRLQKTIVNNSTEFVFTLDDDPSQPLSCAFADDTKTQRAWSIFPHLWTERWMHCELIEDTVTEVSFYESSAWPIVTTAHEVKGVIEGIRVACLMGSYAYSLRLKGDDSLHRAYLCALNFCGKSAWRRCGLVRPGRFVRLGTSDGHLIQTLELT